MYQQPSERAQETLRGGVGHTMNSLFVGVAAATIAAVCAWLFAFGGLGSLQDTAERAQFSSSPPWLTIGSPHQGVADAAVLTLGDLPPGWTLAPDDDDDSEADFELSDQCKELESQASSAGAQASASSDKLKGPANQLVTSEAAVFTDAAAAQGYLDTNRNMFSQCSSELIQAFNTGFQNGLAREGVPASALQFQTAIEDLGSPNVGESGVMYRIRGTVTAPGGSFEFAVDFMGFRHGRMLGGLTYTSLDGLRPEEEQIAQIAAAKLQAANATLPQA